MHIKDLYNASSLGFAFFKHSADPLGHTLIQRHTRLGVLAINNSSTGLAVDCTGVMAFGKFLLNFGLNTSLSSSGYKPGCVHGSLGLNEDPWGLSSRCYVMN